MQHKITLSLLLGCAFILPSYLLNAQSTRALFSKPGLLIGAYHTNIYDGT